MRKAQNIEGDYSRADHRQRPSTPGVKTDDLYLLLPNGSEERGVMGVVRIPVAILPSCQDMKTIAL